MPQTIVSQKKRRNPLSARHDGEYDRVSLTVQLRAFDPKSFHFDLPGTGLRFGHQNLFDDIDMVFTVLGGLAFFPLNFTEGPWSVRLTGRRPYNEI